MSNRGVYIRSTVLDRSTEICPTTYSKFPDSVNRFGPVCQNSLTWSTVLDRSTEFPCLGLPFLSGRPNILSILCPNFEQNGIPFNFGIPILFHFACFIDLSFAASISFLRMYLLVSCFHKCFEVLFSSIRAVELTVWSSIELRRDDPVDIPSG